MIDEDTINEAMDNRFDGIESCVIVEELLGVETENEQPCESRSCGCRKVSGVETQDEQTALCIMHTMFEQVLVPPEFQLPTDVN